MTTTVFVIGLLLVLVAVGLFLSAAPGKGPDFQQGYDDTERQYMPPELAGARLVMSEEKIFVGGPDAIVCRVDQVYQTEDDVLIPVESKIREHNRVYDSDRAELGVQGYMLRHAAPKRLGRVKHAEYGYVRVKDPDGRPRYHRTRLLSDEAVLSLRQRRLDVETGRVPLNGPPTPRVCDSCASRGRCPKLAA